MSISGDEAADSALTCRRLVTAWEAAWLSMLTRLVMPTAPAAGSACPSRDFVAVMCSDAIPPVVCTQ